MYDLKELVENSVKSVYFHLIGRYRYGTLTENNLLVVFLERFIEDSDSSLE